MREIGTHEAVPMCTKLQLGVHVECYALLTAPRPAYSSPKAFSLPRDPSGTHREYITTFYFMDSEAGSWRDKAHIEL